MSVAPAVGHDGPLALVCGGGTLPLAVADSVSKRGRAVVLFPLRGARRSGIGCAIPASLASCGSAWRLYAAGARRRLPRRGVHRVAGAADLVADLRPDFVALMLLPRIMAAYRGGDNHLLTGVSRLVEGKGFRLLGAHEVAPEILVPEGVLGHVEVSEQHREDIAFGLDYLRASGVFDIGQAVVVAGRRVLAVEAAEGTDQMLARVAELRASGRVGAPAGVGVLVKAPKPAQDRRFDLPSIGPTTVAGVARARLAGIAVVGGTTVIAEPERLVSDADRAGIFVVRRAGRNRAMSPHIFLVAGEESGDRLGAALIAAIRQRTQGRAQFSCVGGAHMAAEGVPSLFPLGELAIIGFGGILARLPKILRRIRETADAIVVRKTRCAGYYR